MKTRITSLLSATLLSLGSLWGTTHNVAVSSNVFTPANLTINAGDTVVWTNVSGNHNVNGTTATYPANPASFGNGPASSSNWTYSFIFTTTGTYSYQCDPHVGVGMVGSITVNAAAASKVTIHCWDFNGTAPSGNFNTSPLNTDNRASGSGTLNHIITDVGSFAGNSANACQGSASGSAFCPRGGNNNENNGNHFTIEMPTTGFEDIELSFWARRTGTGFDSVEVQYSTNGGTSFTTHASFDPNSTTSGNIESYDFSSIAAANNNPNFQVRWVLFGASSSAGNNRYDNIKLEGNISTTSGIPTYDIVQVTGIDANGVVDSIGTECNLRGVIHSTNFRSSGYDFMMYDNTGAIGAFKSSNVPGYTFQTGDSVIITGTIGQFRGRAQINVDTIVSLGTVSLRAPRVVTMLDESTENDYVKIDSVYLADPSQWPASGSANVDIVSGTDTLTMRIVSITGIPGTPAPTGNFSVRGAGSQFSFAANLDDGYQILPSSVNDILTGSTPPPPPPSSIPTYNIGDVTTNDASGVADSIGVECKLVGVIHSTNFRSSGMDFMMYDATGAIGVFSGSGVTGYTFQTGDSIRIIGTIGQFRGRTQINPDSIVSFGTVSLRAPKVVTSLDESTENDYVRINNVRLADPSQWPASGSANVDIVRGSDTLAMRLVNVTGIPGTPAPSGAFDVIGAGSQFSFAPNLDDGYQILPSSLSDIIPNTTPPALPKLYVSEIFPKSNLSAPIDGDWFEIRNYGTTPIDLQGMSWDDDSREAGKHYISTSVVVPAGGTAVFLEAATADVPAWENEWMLTTGAVIILNEDNQFNGFSGQGSGGDEVNFYDTDSTLISRATYSSADYVAGFSIEFDSLGTLLGNAVVGVNGAYQSMNGDVGSPGDFSIGLSEMRQQNISLYPNPASERFFIETEHNALKEVVLRSLEGKSLRQTSSYEQNIEVRIDNLPAGVYLLQVSSRGTSSVHKLIIR